MLVRLAHMLTNGGTKGRHNVREVIIEDARLKHDQAKRAKPGIKITLQRSPKL